MGEPQPPYLTIRSLSSNDRTSLTSTDSAYASSSSDYVAPSATHDISRVNYHVKHLDSFAKCLEDSASRAFPNRGRPQQRYSKVIALLMHWKSDDLFVLPELEDLEKCMREDYGFETDTFPIPSENAHLELTMRVGAMIKDHEATDTLFVVYYGGHARIDESRQSTWCATRNSNSPWLQWSAIQTLLERSVSDALILLDCCAGAASATFATGKSITETISASSWDAIAPDPGRYSFTNALIEVLQEWRLRTFSAAMLHAEVLARLKHPRPITINGKLFEARSTPVHFMMTANHRAPSIEIGRILPKNRQLPSPPADPICDADAAEPSGGRGPLGDPVSGPNEDEPHVMISLALEDNQDLDLNAWEQWLASFPALAKYVKVQGVFKSHSTLLLLSVPVMVWDLLPENQACSFIAFIRSDNLLKEQRNAAHEPVPHAEEVSAHHEDVAGEGVEGHREDADDGDVSDADNSDGDGDDAASVISGTTFTPTEGHVPSIRMSIASTMVPSIEASSSNPPHRPPRSATIHSTQRTYPGSYALEDTVPSPSAGSSAVVRSSSAAASQRSGPYQNVTSHSHITSSIQTPAGPRPVIRRYESNVSLSRTMIMNQQRAARQTTFGSEYDLVDGPRLAQHITNRLEEYFQQEPNPSVNITEFFASNLGAETKDIALWFHWRRQQALTTRNLQNLRISDQALVHRTANAGARTILPGHLNTLLDIFPPNQLLFVDLRSPTDFDKSHIYGAVNLRAPMTFVQHSFDLINQAFTDDQSRRNFAKGPSSRCIIFYDRVVEFAWECPVAEVLAEQLRRTKGWQGDYYILKGHFREFSASFDKYITGDKITQAAKDYMDGLRQRPPATMSETETMESRYTEWKTLVESENPTPLTDSLAKQDQRRQAVAEHQAELEAELASRNPSLYHKAMGSRPVSSKRSSSSPVVHDMEKWDMDMKNPAKEPRAELVEPLARGLEKLQGKPTHGNEPGYDKLAEFGDASPSPSVSDDFDEIDSRDEQLHDDPVFLKASDLEEAGNSRMGRGVVSNSDPRRTRERPFWKRLRTTR
ncbi:homeobox domain containing protein [Niveomyces insectorum RCEF 264]|uniref:Homeobox domain containing protein n=1 Tax=Niveomyces insectorum RCEF 264 TaxID=1081102 RepID=A0A167Y2A7_9HYPO|nr:homeobox domain containing protein [Niveomyces insectorum RCEF 264]